MADINDNSSLLLFRVGPVYCCAPSFVVDSIIAPPEMTQTPGSSAAHPGIFRHAAQLVSALELRYQFGVEHEHWEQPGRVIIAGVDAGVIGFWADQIVDVIQMPGSGWSPLPALLPRGVFSRTLMYKERIYLYCEFEKLFRIPFSGYLRPYIEHLQQASAAMKATEVTPSVMASMGRPSMANAHPSPPIGTADHADHITREADPATSPGTPATQPSHATASDSGDNHRPSVAPLKASVTPLRRPALKNTQHTGPGAKAGERPVQPATNRVVPSPDAGVATRSADSASIHQTQHHATAATRDLGARPGATRYSAHAGSSVVNAASSKSSLTTETAESVAADSLVSTPKTITPEPATARLHTPHTPLPPQPYDEPAGASLWPWLLVLFFIAAPGVGLYWYLLPEPSSGQPGPSSVPPNTAVSAYVPPPKPEPIQAPVQQPDPLPVATSEPVHDEADTMIEPATSASATTSGQGPSVQPASEPAIEAASPPGPAPISAPTAPTGYRAEIQQDESGITIILDTPDESPTFNPPAKPMTTEPASQTPEPTLAQTKAGSPEPAPQEDEPPQQSAASHEEGVHTASPPVAAALKPEPAARPAPTPKTEEIIHIVVKGDTLWHIARRYVHNPYRYPELARLSNIRNPDRIYPGNRVRIIKRRHTP